MDCSINAACGPVQGSAVGPVYRHRCVVPDLPPPEAFLHHLEAAQAANWFSNFGPVTLRLEAALADTYGTPGEVCISASSATAGLSAALLACGRAGPVLIPAFTFPASAGAVRAALVMDFSSETSGRSLKAALNAGTPSGVR